MFIRVLQEENVYSISAGETKKCLIRPQKLKFFPPFISIQNIAYNFGLSQYVSMFAFSFGHPTKIKSVYGEYREFLCMHLMFSKDRCEELERERELEILTEKI